jgi:hypothetical protein
MQISGLEITDVNRLWYMYNDIDKKNLVNKFHGRGFTYYGDLLDRDVNRNNIEIKIKNKYFDKIIYGNIRRCADYLKQVFENYNKKDIIFLDGNDEHNQPGIYEEFVNLYKSSNVKGLEFLIVYGKDIIKYYDVKYHAEINYKSSLYGSCMNYSNENDYNKKSLEFYSEVIL